MSVETIVGAVNVKLSVAVVVPTEFVAEMVMGIIPVAEVVPVIWPVL